MLENISVTRGAYQASVVEAEQTTGGDIPFHHADELVGEVIRYMNELDSS